MFLQVSWAAESKKHNAVVPFYLNYEFLFKDRKGFQMQMGWTQDIKIEFLNLELGLGDCSAVSKDGVTVDDRKVDYNMIAKLLCALQPQLNKWMQEAYYDVIFSKVTMSGHIPKYYGVDNEWYPMPEMPHSNYARCSGMHAKQALVSFGDDYMAVNLQLEQEHWIAPQYCDSEHL